MTRSRRAPIALAAAFAVGIACWPSRSIAEELYAASISPARLAALLGARDAPVVLDVRSGREYEKGHVPGAVHMPFWTLLARASLIPSALDRPLVVYCEHGPRAGLAKLQLRLRGFRHVVVLEGHMTAWRKSGLPVQVGPSLS